MSMGGPVADDESFSCQDEKSVNVIEKSSFTMNPNAPVFFPTPSFEMSFDSAFGNATIVNANVNTKKASGGKGKQKRTQKHTLKESGSTEVMVGNVDPNINFGRLVAMLDTQCGRVKSTDFSAVLDGASTIGFVVFCNPEDAEKAAKITHFEGHRIIISRCISGKGNTGSGGAATSNILVLKNLPFGLKLSQLKSFLDQLEIQPSADPVLLLDSNGSFRGIAQVQYRNKNDARNAFQLLDHAEYQGRDIRVEYKKRQEDSAKTKKSKKSEVKQERKKETSSSTNADQCKELKSAPIPIKVDPNLSGAKGKESVQNNKDYIRRRSRGVSAEWVKGSHWTSYDAYCSQSPGTLGSSPIQFSGKGSTMRERGRERSGGSNVSLQNDRYARGPDGSKGFPSDRGRSYCIGSSFQVIPVERPSLKANVSIGVSALSKSLKDAIV